MFSIVASLLIGIALSASNLVIENHEAVQDYYFRVNLVNGDLSSCGASLRGVYLLEQGSWRKNQQTETTNGWTSVGWNYANVAFSQMIPISLRIETSVETFQLDGIITNMNSGAQFNAGRPICDGTAAPTTPKPTSRPTPPTTPFPTAERVCINKDSIQWRSFGNQIYLNGNRFNMKGLSWFGFETGNYGLYGLDKHNMNWYFDWMLERGFNAIRLPFSSDYINGGGLNDYVAAVKAAGEKGIFIMADMHSKTPGNWRDGLYTINQDEEVGTWTKIAEKLVAENAWNVMMVDVFNEPHDVTNEQWGDWINFCERVGRAVWNAGLNSLIAVEGTNYECSVISCAWGENLEGVRNKGITFDETSSGANRFVWSPHVYGGDVTGSYTYSEAAWNAHWGYLVGSSEAAIVIGEFGTTFSGSMVNWLKSLVTYLISIDQRNHFYWCLNPNSGDTGGLLKSDWTTAEDGKLAELDRLQPNPSVVTVNANNICVSGLGGSSVSPPVSSPVAPPVSSPVTPPTPPPVPSSGGSTIGIKQNGGSSNWWLAIETVPSSDLSRISKLEFKDSNHNSWVEGEKTDWGVVIPTQGKAFSGSQHYRVTTSGGRMVNNNVFSGVSPGATATLTVASSYTEDDSTVGSSSLTWAGLAAIIVCSLIFVLCIGAGVWYYKKNQKNKGEVSFETTAPDTPVGGDTPEPQQVTTNNDSEIEVEMNVNEDGQNITATSD